MESQDVVWEDASVHVWLRRLSPNAHVRIGLVLVAGTEPIGLLYNN